jgi:phosphatidylglycerophosphate synthase
MKLFGQYKASLKSVEIEEFSDLVFFRPLAFVFVKLFYKTPLTPNHISIISMAVGIASGIALATGTPNSFVIGGILYILATAIDCSDGMIARLKKNGTKIGRIIDGAVDYITTISVYLGMAIGLTKMVAANTIELPMNPWLLVVIMGAAHSLHSIVTDYYRNKYESHVFNKPLDAKSQLEEFEEEKQRLSLQKGRKIEKFIVKQYVRYCKLQVVKQDKPPVKYKSESYTQYNRVLIFLWNIIGPSGHILMLAISLIILTPMLFFWFVVVFANAWMLLLFAFQKYFDKKLEVEN